MYPYLEKALKELKTAKKGDSYSQLVDAITSSLGYLTFNDLQRVANTIIAQYPRPKMSKLERREE